MLGSIVFLLLAISCVHCQVTYTPFVYQLAEQIVPNPAFSPSNKPIPPITNPQTCGQNQGIYQEFASAITPDENDPNFKACNPTQVNCPSASDIGELPNTPSRLAKACDGNGFLPTDGAQGKPCNFREYVDYAYYQTNLTIPCGFAVDSFSIFYANNSLDDGAQVKIFNCNYPDGVIASSNNLCVVYCQPEFPDGCTTGDMSQYLTCGQNRILITHVDDNPGSVGIIVKVQVNGQNLTTPSCSQDCVTASYNETSGTCDNSTNAADGTSCQVNSCPVQNGTCQKGQCVAPTPTPTPSPPACVPTPTPSPAAKYPSPPTYSPSYASYVYQPSYQQFGYPATGSYQEEYQPNYQPNYQQQNYQPSYQQQSYQPYSTIPLVGGYQESFQPLASFGNYPENNYQQYSSANGYPAQTGNYQESYQPLSYGGGNQQFPGFLMGGNQDGYQSSVPSYQTSGNYQEGFPSGW